MAAAREGVQVGIEGNSARDAGQDKVAAAVVSLSFFKKGETYLEMLCVYIVTLGRQTE